MVIYTVELQFCIIIVAFLPCSCTHLKELTIGYTQYIASYIIINDPVTTVSCSTESEMEILVSCIRCYCQGFLLNCGA